MAKGKERGKAIGVWMPQEDEPLACDWCGGLITSPEHPFTLERDYCSTACQSAFMDAADELEAAKAERAGEWMSL